MGKSLVSKLRDGAKRTLLVTTALIGLASCKDCDPVLNTSPEFTSTPITQVVEGNAYGYDANAQDAENDTLEYSLAHAPSWLSINSETGMISGTAPEVSANTNYDIEVEVSDGIAEPVSQNFTVQIVNVPDAPVTPPVEPPVIPPVTPPPVTPPPVEPPVDNDYLDISGRLEDCENDETAVPGVIKVYNALNNTLLRTVEDDDGIFSFSLEQLVSELSSGIILQAATGTSEIPTSYIRTVSFPQGDVTGALVRVVPTGDLTGEGITTAEFREHMDEVNFVNLPGYGLFKYNISNVEIIRNNPFNAASFSDTEILLIKNKIQNLDDVGSYAPGVIFNIDDNEVRDHYDLANPKINPHQGWIIVIPVSSGSDNPDLTLVSGGLAEMINSGLPQVYGSGKILLLSREQSTVSHEFGHALAFPGHAITLSGTQSIMNPATGQSNPRFADKKAAKIVYETTYLPRETLNNIMRLSWGFSVE